MSSYIRKPRSRVRRLAGRGVYDRDTVHASLDEPGYALPIRAGVVPVALKAAKPADAPRLAGGTDTPVHARRYGRRLAGRKP